MLPTTIINSFAIALSLSTATGIVMHDTKLDKATITVLSPVPSASTTAANQVSHSTPHTHVERVSFSEAAPDLKASNPRIQPRSDDKKHLLPKRVMRGHHAFDNYTLPIV